MANDKGKAQTPPPVSESEVPGTTEQAKQLAELQGRVQELDQALALAGFELEEGQDPIGLAIAVINARHHDSLAAAQHLVESGVDATAHVQGGGSLVTALVDHAKGLLEHVGKLSAALADAGGDAEAGLDAPIVRPDNARDVGPQFPQVDREDLEAMIADNARFELVFSDGKAEIADFEPIRIPSSDLAMIARRRQVSKPVFVKGATGPREIDGAGLLLNGEQVAYCKFPSAVRIEPGQERRFERALTFG